MKIDVWENKAERSKIAKEHTKQMEVKFGDEIKEVVGNSEIINGDDNINNTITKNHPNQILVNDDSVSACFKYKDGVTCVLNFSSYKNPGGMFYEGSKAQEECLCHESYLYNVLKEIKDFYEWNKNNLNKALYKNRAIYSKDVRFVRGEKNVRVDVLTCASPNFKAANKYKNVTREENHEVLKNRIKFIKNICENNGVKTLILGAYGCGVFGQDAYEVALLFKTIFTNSEIENIYYAVPDKVNSENYDAFNKVFNEK